MAIFLLEIILNASMHSIDPLKRIFIGYFSWITNLLDDFLQNPRGVDPHF